MFPPDHLDRLSDTEVVEEATRYVEQRPCHNISVLLRCPDPVRVARHLRVALREVLHRDAPTSPSSVAAPPVLPPPPSDGTADRKARAVVDRLPLQAIQTAAAKANMTIEEYRDHLLNRFRAGYAG